MACSNDIYTGYYGRTGRRNARKNDYDFDEFRFGYGNYDNGYTPFGCNNYYNARYDPFYGDGYRNNNCIEEFRFFERGYRDGFRDGRHSWRNG